MSNMTLLLSNPRPYPRSKDRSIDANGCGFNDFAVRGIRSIFPANGFFNIRFESYEAAQQAKQLTGWKDGAGSNSLIFSFYGDCARCLHANDGSSATEVFYDWTVIGSL